MKLHRCDTCLRGIPGTPAVRTIERRLDHDVERDFCTPKCAMQHLDAEYAERVLTEADFDVARDALAESRYRMVAEAWDERSVS